MSLGEFTAYLDGVEKREEGEWIKAAWVTAHMLNAWKGRRGAPVTVDRLLKRRDKKAAAAVDESKAMAENAAFVAAFDAAAAEPGMSKKQLAAAQKQAFIARMRAMKAKEK